MRWPKPLVKATLLKRYKRFLADVQLETGECITVHCPNTGAMTGCDAPGSEVWLLASDNPKRKYPFTWEVVSAGGNLVCIHSARANALVAEVVEEMFPEYHAYEREVKLASGSRVDFGLESDKERCFIEVKSVTLLTEGGTGQFPDAVSKRASKHLEELIELKRKGHRAVLFFAALHSGITSVSPAKGIDPVYAETLDRAKASGVEVMAMAAEIDECQIALATPLPVLD